MTINRAPMAQPIKAPTIGINAVKLIKMLITNGYGSCTTTMTTKNIPPKIKASNT